MKTTNMGQQDNAADENLRRVMASLLMWGGWIGASLIFAWATLQYDPNAGQFAPQWVGFTFIGLLCVAIAGTLVRSRMRLQDTIIHAFTIGIMAAKEAVDIEHQEIRRELDGLADADD